MKASELKNHPIVSLNDGVKVGETADLSLDSTFLQVSAILLSGHDGTSVIPFKAVRNIGPDAVTIDDARIVQAPADKDGLPERRVSSLTGLPVMNETGTVIGNIDDVEFDEASGRLSALLIHRGGVLGIGAARESIAASAIRGFGPTLVTVDQAAVTTPLTAS
jgi:sporulation protein YlmC with PRC-barrel domain